MAGKKGQKKRFWSDEEKISICVQSCAPGVSVAQVARRYAMNANLIHKWLRDPKFAPDPEHVEAEAIEASCFLPVEIIDQRQNEGVAPALDAKPVQSAIEIDLPPKAPSFITRVCGFGFHSLWVRIGQARRARSPQIAQASGARLQVTCS